MQRTGIFKYILQIPKIYGTLYKPSLYLRNITTGKCAFKNYEGDGKTTVTILNREHRDLVLVDSLSNVGFRLNNGIFAVGPVAVFPRTVLQWNVSCASEITPESLSLFCLLEPKLDILIIGTGDKREQPSIEALKYLKENKIHVEVLTTEHAIATFNFLNVEKRCIAGALIPPTSVLTYEDEYVLIGRSDVDDFTPVETKKEI